MTSRILVIEDNATNLDLLLFLLHASGYTPIAATDGLAGIRRAAELLPDLIICDIQLPTIDGYEVARRIKRQPELRSIPLVAVTACAMPADRTLAITAGFDGYISKPISPATFCAQIEDFLGARQKGDQGRRDQGVQRRQGLDLSKDRVPSTHSQAVKQQIHADERGLQDDADISVHLRSSAVPNELGTRYSELGGGQLILLAEHIAANTDLLTAMLEPSGYRIVLARTVADALDRLRSHDRPLAALVELDLPGGGATRLLQHALADGIRGDVDVDDLPIFVLAPAGTGSDLLQQVGALGAAEVIRWPIDPANLLQAIGRRQMEPVGTALAEEKA